KRIPIHIKQLLETMFHAGTANLRNKMTAEEDIPKESTIANWITSFSRGWKHAMALQAIEAAEYTLNARESLETS
ncbi:10224_t:CDS:2, partial [Funneliformis caledonium]